MYSKENKVSTYVSTFQYASTIVTYMVVLVQFDQAGQSDTKSNGNETTLFNCTCPK